ncbi:hypothetical protein NM688_g6712 [Phlebia brevispora]|uniref:Uncharacterized protein n=1 Tax=Phlebia brevispora TaxID=194682 RepID=A0ACC1SD88_9APHY|nr:hypothetical protein NM688_g6712 [Phlebia brevispora]
MATLQLTVSAFKDPKCLATYEFTHKSVAKSTEDGACDSDEASQPPLRFTQSDLVHEGTSKVYKGTLVNGGDTPLRVVCKLIQESPKSNPAWLDHEAAVYENKLADLQGICVPRFYGLFTGTIADKPASCIILEDCGVALQGYFSAYPQEVSIKSFQLLMAVHKRGVEHRDFWPRNIVVDNVEQPTRYNLIDFEGSYPRHQCLVEGPEIEIFNFPRVQCPELSRIGLELQLFVPWSVRFFGSGVNILSFRGAEGLARAGRRPATLTDEQILQEARRVLGEYGDKYRRYRDYVAGKKTMMIKPLA